jgi:hypothetical protein
VLAGTVFQDTHKPLQALGPKGKPGTITFPVMMQVLDKARNKVKADPLTVSVTITKGNPIAYFAAGALFLERDGDALILRCGAFLHRNGHIAYDRCAGQRVESWLQPTQR